MSNKKSCSISIERCLSNVAWVRLGFYVYVIKFSRDLFGPKICFAFLARRNFFISSEFLCRHNMLTLSSKKRLIFTNLLFISNYCIKSTFLSDLKLIMKNKTNCIFPVMKESHFLCPRNFATLASLRHVTSPNVASSEKLHFAKKRHFAKKTSLRQETSFRQKTSLRQKSVTFYKRAPYYGDVWRSDAFVAKWRFFWKNEVLAN